MSEEKETYAVVKSSGHSLAAYSEEQFTDLIESLYPGATPLVKRATVVLGQRYDLDPLLREIMIIEFKQYDQEERKYKTTYSPYIGRKGMERIANRSGIKWSFNPLQPKRCENPYTGKEDVYLEGDLFRTGYPTMRWGLWLSEVSLTDKDGKLMATWGKKTAMMHQKSLEKHCLERAFSVTVPGIPQGYIAPEDEEFEASENGEIVDSTATEIIAREPLELMKYLQKLAGNFYADGKQGEITEEWDAWLQAKFSVLFERPSDAKFFMKTVFAYIADDGTGVCHAMAIRSWLEDTPEEMVHQEIKDFMEQATNEGLKPKKGNKAQAEVDQAELFG